MNPGASIQRSSHSGLALVSIFAMTLVLTPQPGRAEQTQETPPSEIGVPAPSSKESADPSPEVTELDARLELSVQYISFTDPDMKSTYGGLPMVSAGMSFKASQKTRVFLSIGYGENRGNPYHNISGFQGNDDIQVESVPFQMGVKTDLARSEVVEFFMGASFEIAWHRETFPDLDGNGNLVEAKASGINTGFQLFLGPEIQLGSGGNSLGFEIGWGGSKGTVEVSNHAHHIDVTGFRGRIYLAFSL